MVGGDNSSKSFLRICDRFPPVNGVSSTTELALPIQMNAQADAHGRAESLRRNPQPIPIDAESGIPEISTGHLHQAPTAKSSD